MAKISLQPGSSFDVQLKTGVTSNVFRQLNNRLALNANSIRQEIGNYIISIFEQTDVVKSLRGGGTTDLQAHFGLSNSSANSLVDGMVNIIKNSIFISSIKQGFSGSISLKAVETNWIPYTQLPGAKYLSKPSNIEIPVIEWMLVDPNIDIGQAAYNIVFHGEEGGKFNQVIERSSRSGRAIMVSLETLGGGGGYVLPGIVRQASGRNFIEFAIGQPHVAQNIVNILIKRIR